LNPGATTRQRLTVEAKAASALDHPNIATIYEIDASDEGRPYIAMAYYEGESLADRIALGPLPAEEAVAIAAQVADGLAAAHARGIVHRDVKAGNVILTPGGVAKILDFGRSSGDGVAGGRRLCSHRRRRMAAPAGHHGVRGTADGSPASAASRSRTALARSMKTPSGRVRCSR
jgi:serine/threonine protein kinase